MPITLPNLDDRRYADLMKEALAIIPVQAPEWTNHNPSDPGITFVEMFAYLTEMLIYRLNRVTVENTVTFLNLIDAGERNPDEYRDRARLTEEVRKVVLELRRPYRAVTCEDFNELVLRDFSQDVERVVTTVLNHERRDKKMVAFINLFIVPVLRSTVLLKRAAAYSDHSSDLKRPGNLPFPLVAAANEYLYIGMEATFDAIRFSLSSTVSGYELNFEYSRGGDEEAGQLPDKAQWARLTETENRLTDYTSNWAASGLAVFAPPKDWQPATVNTKRLYWVRLSAGRLATNQANASALQVAVQSVPGLSPTAGNQSLLTRIKENLDHRRLLTTRLRVDGPRYRKMAVRDLILNLKPDAREAGVIKAAQEELSRFFHPLIGGRDGKGWPFGRDVYLSEIIERLAGLPGVEFVERSENPIHVIDSTTGQLTPQKENSLKIESFELIEFSITDSQFTIKPAPDPRRLKPLSK